MNEIVYLNHQFLPISEAAISPLDRGFLFADGVYEVVPVHAGIPFFWHEHLARLKYSLQAIHLTYAYDEHDWENILTSLLQENGVARKHSLLYLQVTRGTMTGRIHQFSQRSPSTAFAMLQPFNPPTFEYLAQGHHAICVPDIRWSRCDIKSIALLGNVLAAHQAFEQQAVDAIQIRDGYAYEGAKTNILIVKQKTVITPPLSPYLLPGITRQQLLNLLSAQGIAYEERLISQAELYSADEVWLTSSSQDIIPITSIDTHTIGNGTSGPVWHQMIHRFQALRAQ